MRGRSLYHPPRSNAIDRWLLLDFTVTLSLYVNPAACDDDMTNPCVGFSFTMRLSDVGYRVYTFSQVEDPAPYQ